MSIYFVSGIPVFENTSHIEGVQEITPVVLFSKEISTINKLKGLIIDCALNMDERGERVDLSTVYGVNLARELRLRGVTIPMVFVSFLPFKELLNQAQFGLLLKAIGHEFVQWPTDLPQLKNKLEGMNALSPLELRDVQLFSCKPEGVVRTKTHQIPSLVSQFVSGAVEAVWVKSELESWISEMHRAFQTDAALDLNTFNKDFSTITPDTIEAACVFVKQTGEKLIRGIKHGDEPTTMYPADRKPWKVLMLDDELTENSLMVELIKQKGGNVICTTNAEEARLALEEDDEHRGKICLLLCDYRLFETRDGIREYYQKTQGYSFLHQVGEKFQSRLLSAVVYSGLPRQFLIESFKSFKIRTEIYSKIDFDLNDTKSMNFLASRIIELGDENYEALLSLPLSNNGWVSHLHKWYIHYRSKADYQQKEREISDYCSNWVADFIQGNNPKSPIGKGEQIPQDGFDTKNERFCIFCSKYLIPEDESIVEKRLKRFEEIFKTRRIAQYLYLYFHHHNRQSDVKPEILDQVFAAIKPANRQSVSSSARKRFLNVILGLSLTDFPLGTTIEELNWFHYDMDFELLNSYKRFRKRIYATEEFTGEIIMQFPFLKNRLAENNFSIERHRNINTAVKDNRLEITNEVVFNRKSFKPYLFNKADIGLVINWLGEQFTNRGKDEMRYFMEDYCDKLKEQWK